MYIVPDNVCILQKGHNPFVVVFQLITYKINLAIKVMTVCFVIIKSSSLSSTTCFRLVQFSSVQLGFNMHIQSKLL